MKILVLNSGSSSVKYQLWEMGGNGLVAKGLVSRIGIADPLLEHTTIGKQKITITPNGKIDHTKAIELALAALTNPEYGVIKNINEIEAVGHRVVHGGEDFSGSVYLDEPAMFAVRECVQLAPLHNPPNIKGIEACEVELPGIPQCGIFDTAFHHTIPKRAYIYGIPIELYKKHKIRRYGFHGTSHYFVAHEAAKLLNRPIEELKIITCHLGNGASITAVDKGKSVDTTMGFTPLEGLLMGTRAGDMDPYVPLFIQKVENLNPDQVSDLLNKKSGLIGISGVSSDMRDILATAGTNELSHLALDIYCYRIRKYIGAYAAAMGGLDAVVFTAGIGENSEPVRSLIVEGLAFMGIEVDKQKNVQAISKKMDISTPGAKVRTLVVPTDEEYVIARETERIVCEMRAKK
jgi:acetate kinase